MKEIKIPEGYEARIEGNKGVFVPNESENERIRKEILECIETLVKQKELPLMNGDADEYFDNWQLDILFPTKRQCFEEWMRYAQRLQKEQKPVKCSNSVAKEMFIKALERAVE